jgi:hypothetical protein
MRRKGTFGGKTKKRIVSRKDKTENMTDERWKKVIAAIANGSNRTEAAKAAGISKLTLDAYLVTNITASGQLHEAKLLWLRREWPDERIDEVLEQIMRGKTLPVAFAEAGIPEESQSGLYRLMLNDRAVRKRYDEAREIQAETFVDEIVSIADGRGNDRDADGKPNHELVNRDRLRVDTRKFVMSTMNGKRFSEKKQIEHTGDLNINHAAVLTGGRKRVEQLHGSRSRKQAVIDNDTGAVS